MQKIVQQGLKHPHIISAFTFTMNVIGLPILLHHSKHQVKAQDEQWEASFKENVAAEHFH